MKKRRKRESWLSLLDYLLPYRSISSYGTLLPISQGRYGTLLPVSQGRYGTLLPVSQGRYGTFKALGAWDFQLNQIFLS